MAPKIKVCQSCSLPLEESSQHACGDVEIPYCVRCVTPHGLLKSKDDVRSQLVRFYTKSLKMKKGEAEKKTESKLKVMFS